VITSGAANPYAWSLQPEVLLAAAIVAFAYGWRFRGLRRRGELRRDAGWREYARLASFSAGLAVLVAAFVSPIDGLGEERLFTVHMVQHLMIIDIGPILLLLGLSRPLLRPVVRTFRPVEERLGLVAHPLTALLLLIVVMSAWHVPAAYELALRHSWAHQLEHLTFFTAGTAFWWYVIEPVPPRHRLRGMATVGYVTGAKLALAALGVVLAFSPSAFYETYKEAPRAWGLTPLEDQNVGGLVMMVEQTIVLAVFFAISFMRMLTQSEEAERRRERFGVPQ
jgi:putative membrane protein